MTRDRFLRQALRALSEAASEHLERHPLGHLIRDPATHLELTLPVPLHPAGLTEESVREAAAGLRREIEALIAHRAAFQPGRVMCLRCASAGCEHSAPADSRQVFAGYGPSGVPRFLDYGQWLLERRHAEVDRLYRRPPQLVTVVVSGRELHRELLPAFRDRATDYRIHGQVNAGWFPLRREGASQPLLALSFQVLSAASSRGRRRLALNILGAGPDGEPLEELYHRLDSIPWRSPVEWSQSVLASIERSQGRKSATPEQLSQRVEGVLTSIARRLEQNRRARDRRTGHAEKRHAEGERPTRMAHVDLTRAADEQILFDRRRETLVVIGQKGRVHVYNPDGKLVTSIRATPDAIARKRRQDIWRPARPEEIARLRKSTR